MFTLEDFGITPAFVTAVIAGYSVGFLVSCAAAMVLWCLFGIGLARIAEKRGEEKPYYAYLPLLRYYTLGKMVPCEKSKKIFACLLPSLAIIKFIMEVVCAALCVRAAAGLVFAAENMAGSSIPLSAIIEFPLSYCAAAIVITAVISLALKIVTVISLYGACRDMGQGLAVTFAVITFIWGSLGGVFLYVASLKKESEKTQAQEDDSVVTEEQQ